MLGARSNGSGEFSDAAHSELDGKTVLVTGATGSFGRAFVSTLLEHFRPTAIRLYSRDELKQHEIRQLHGEDRLRFLIGDVRDLARLSRAMRGVDVVIHAAALKQVPVCEYNPFEAVQTNVVGAENVVSAAIEADVPKTLALSSDKAVNPVNLYGATKLCAEKIVTQGNAYAGDSVARFASVRYGNVVGSRGSVIPLFLKQAREGRLTITDEAMTRFWITLPEAVAFVIASLARMSGGEIFVPRIPSMRVGELADALAPGVDRTIIGVRPGEKVHEVLITEDESRHAMRFEEHFVIAPAFPFWDPSLPVGGEPLPPGYRYSSDKNDEWLTDEEMRELAGNLVATS
jgi:UDP-N-acetylglucosamine 4,6-dehydratase (inverting)